MAAFGSYLFECFSCNTSGPCLPSDKALAKLPEFRQRYERHKIRAEGMTFFYWVPRDVRARAPEAPRAHE